MAVNDSRLPTRQAAFADAAQAERAVAQLQSHGIDAARISVEHGGTTAPGRTTAADREIAARGSRTTRRLDTEHRELRDAVRVIVATKPGEDETVRRVLGEQGGAAD